MWINQYSHYRFVGDLIATNYPGSLDTTTQLDNTWADSDATATAHPAAHANLADAVLAVEAELGTDPAGLYATTVRERFEISSYKNQSCRMATTAALAAVTYANGTAGVGATLTANSNGVMAAVDGITPAVGDRILVKDQAAALQHGVYTVTSVGAAGATFVLTRAIDADTSAKIADMRMLVDLGTVNGDTEWGCVATAPTMGTTALPFKRTMPIYGHGNPRFTYSMGGDATPVIAESIPRVLALGGMTTVLTTATQYIIGGFVIPAGRTVSNINYFPTTAGAAPTISWFAIARLSDRVVQAHTANIVTAPTVNTKTTRALTAAWTPNYDTPVFVVMSYQVATTAMVLSATPNGNAQANLTSPAVFGVTATVPTTTVPTDGSTTIAATASSAILNVPYIWLT